MDQKAQVLQAERDWLNAHLEMDLDLLDRLMHPEYTRIQPDGSVWNRSQTLASYQSGQRQWDSASIDELDIRIYGQTAVVTGRWQASGENFDSRFDYAARYVSVWCWTEERWQMVSDQSTEIAREE
jgi:ketosteroid isomerase-like protein